MNELKVTLSLDEDEAYKAWLNMMQRLAEVEKQFLKEVLIRDSNE
jgi:hypothetical protein